MISAGDRRIDRRIFEREIAGIGSPFHPPEGSSFDQPTVPQQKVDLYPPMPRALQNLYRLLAATASGVLQRLGGMRTSYADFSIMKNAAGTGFYVKKISDDKMVIAGTLAAASEFVHSLHENDWQGVRYVTLARTAAEIKKIAFRPRREWQPLSIASDSPALGIHADVRGNIVTGVIEITFDLPVTRKEGDTWDEYLARFQASHIRRVEETSLDSSLDKTLAAIKGLLHEENGRGARYLDSLLTGSRLSSDRIGRNIGEVNAGLSVNQYNEIVALTIRCIETLDGLVESRDTNVVEFTGALDPADPLRRTIIWKMGNVGSFYRSTDARFLRPDDLMEQVRILFCADVTHKIALTNGSGGPPEGTHGTLPPGAGGVGIGPLTGGSLAGHAIGGMNPLTLSGGAMGIFGPPVPML